MNQPGLIDSVQHSDQPEIAIRMRYHDFSSPLEEMIIESITDKRIAW